MDPLLLLALPLIAPCLLIVFYVWRRHEERKAVAERRKAFDRIMQANHPGGLR